MLPVFRVFMNPSPFNEVKNPVLRPATGVKAFAPVREFCPP